MSNIRQLALAVILVAGTTFAVAGYMDSQSGKIRSEAEAGAVILELQPMRAMARPLCATTKPVAGKFNTLASPSSQGAVIGTPAPTTVRTKAGWSSASTSTGSVEAISTIFVIEERPKVIPASSAKPVAF